MTAPVRWSIVVRVDAPRRPKNQITSELKISSVARDQTIARAPFSEDAYYFENPASGGVLI